MAAGTARATRRDGVKRREGADGCLDAGAQADGQAEREQRHGAGERAHGEADVGVEERRAGPDR